MFELFLAFGGSYHPLIQWLLLAAWPVPAMVAYYRHHQRRHLVCILTFVLGWLNPVWVAILLWALVGKTETTEVPS